MRDPLIESLPPLVPDPQNIPIYTPMGWQWEGLDGIPWVPRKVWLFIIMLLLLGLS